MKVFSRDLNSSSNLSRSLPVEALAHTHTHTQTKIGDHRAQFDAFGLQKV